MSKHLSPRLTTQAVLSCACFMVSSAYPLRHDEVFVKRYFSDWFWFLQQKLQSPSLRKAKLHLRAPQLPRLDKQPHYTKGVEHKPWKVGLQCSRCPQTKQQ